MDTLIGYALMIKQLLSYKQNHPTSQKVGFIFIYFYMLDIVENNFNIVKNNTTLLEVEEVSGDVYDSSLTLLAEEFNYLEVIE